MKIHLVTYGDHHYIKQLAVFKAEAVQSSFFDEVHIFSPGDMQIGFYTAIYKPLKSFRGGGYWIWKPYFVKKVMDTIADDDILIYCDAGCTLNHRGKDRFDEYVSLLSAAKTGSLDFLLFQKEYQYTKREAFVHFNSDDHAINSSQIHATVLLLKKCPHTVFLVNDWYHTAVNRPDLFSDEITLEQHPDFLDHRHDQSIFSLIRKKYGANIILDETGYFNSDLRFKYPFWARRLKDEDYL